MIPSTTVVDFSSSKLFVIITSSTKPGMSSGPRVYTVQKTGPGYFRRDWGWTPHHAPSLGMAPHHQQCLHRAHDLHGGGPGHEHLHDHLHRDHTSVHARSDGSSPVSPHRFGAAAFPRPGSPLTPGDARKAAPEFSRSVARALPPPSCSRAPDPMTRVCRFPGAKPGRGERAWALATAGARPVLQHTHQPALG